MSHANQENHPGQDRTVEKNRNDENNHYFILSHIRSTDLLSLPNVNPDASYGMQISIEDDLTSQSVVCFQVNIS